MPIHTNRDVFWAELIFKDEVFSIFGAAMGCVTLWERGLPNLYTRKLSELKWLIATSWSNRSKNWLLFKRESTSENLHCRFCYIRSDYD